MAYETIIGLIAGITTGTSLLPQLFKITKKKKPDTVSLGVLILLFIGLSGWIYYGVLKMDWIIIASNLFSLMINIFITILFFRYKRAHTYQRSYFMKKASNFTGKTTWVKLKSRTKESA